MSFDENNFEKPRFNPFGFDNVLLNNTNAPNENMLNNLSQVEPVLMLLKKLHQVLKKLNDKLFLRYT